VPMLQKLAPEQSIQSIRTYRLIGLGESFVESQVGEALLQLGIELGYCAKPGQVDLRVIGPKELLERAELIITEKLGPRIVSCDNRSLEKVVVDRLSQRGQSLATAESCTGGFLAHSLTNVPGASKVFLAGFVTYANQAKTRDLGVDPELIRQHGAVSESVAAEMARGALRVSGADYALATTGIAGPEGGTPEKPLGTVFIALAAKSGALEVQAHRFASDRETFKLLVCQSALDLLRQHLGD
jgi:nicotinamide-nucleotide amidase